MPSLCEGGAEMHIENVKNIDLIEHQIRPERASLFATADGYVVVLYVSEGQPAEDYVAVCPSQMPAVFTDSILEAKLLRDKAGLIFLTRAAIQGHNFLKRNYIRIHFREHVNYPTGPDTTIDPAAFVNVICCNTQIVRWLH
jgi:hypothetical protein